MDKTNLTRWTYSSIAKHFSTYANGTAFYIEGQTIEDDKLDRAELRINGPFISHPTKNEWYIDIEINLLLTCGMVEEDAYKIWKYVGQWLEAFTDSISVFKFGDGPSDDEDELVSCLIMQHDRGDDIILTQFGQVDPTMRVLQSTLNALYSMYITDT